MVSAAVAARASALLNAPHMIARVSAPAAAPLWSPVAAWTAAAMDWAIAPNTPVTLSSAMTPATTSHAVRTGRPSLRSSRSVPRPANRATANATAKNAIPGARVFLTMGMRAHHTL